MANETLFTLEGAEDIQRVLLSLPTQLARRGLVDAFKAGAEDVAAEARLQAMAQGIDVFDDDQEAYRDAKRVRRHSGQFYENIVAVVTSFRGRKFVGQDSVVQVAVRKGFSSLAHIFEFGTGPRRRKDGSSTGQITARPFLRPALDIAGPGAIDKISRRTGQNVEIIVNQLSRGQKVSLRRKR